MLMHALYKLVICSQNEKERLKRNTGSSAKKKIGKNTNEYMTG